MFQRTPTLICMSYFEESMMMIFVDNHDDDDKAEEKDDDNHLLQLSSFSRACYPLRIIQRVRSNMIFCDNMATIIC